MKIQLLNCPFRAIRFAAILAVAGWALRADAVIQTMTPATISNTYAGVLTLQITGLTNGEPVNIERFLDSNGNGLVDPGEPLVDSFPIRDGGASVIGGITNVNVPFDSNPASGAITATLSLAPPIERVVGKQIFRFSSPSGNFAPQTNILTVTNAALAQSISGTVSAGGLPLPYAMTVILSYPQNNFVTAVFTDALGNYFVKLDPGTYILLPALPGYFTDSSLAPVVTLTNNGSSTANLFLTNGSAASTISGQVSDATNGAPLGGVFIQLESGDLFAVAFSDSSGNYSAPLRPALWKIKLESSRLARRAYVSPQDGTRADTTTGSVAGVNFLLPKANALFYGRLADGASVPFPNCDFYAQGDLQQLRADGFSDSSGNYAVGVFANGNPWNCSVSTGENPQLQNYMVSSGLGTTNISAGQALRQDFVVVRATGQISGHLQDNLGNPLSGVGISGNVVIGSTSFNVYSPTDNSGNYVLPAASGNWTVYINCCGGEGLDSFGLFDPFNHNVSLPPTNAILNLIAYPTGTPFLTQPMRLSPTQFGFNLNGTPGTSYTIKASTDLVNWTNLFITNLTSNSLFLQDNQATSARKFYRVLKN